MVLATNVAETSLTIDDITVVIDTGRVKQTQFDALNSCSQLVETWTARSSRRQRRGRAGRVQKGEYYALYSHAQERRLVDHAPPEIARVPLEALYLQVRCQPTVSLQLPPRLTRYLLPCPTPLTVCP